MGRNPRPLPGCKAELDKAAHEFESAKAYHEQLQREFRTANADFRREQAAYQAVKAEHERLAAQWKAAKRDFIKAHDAYKDRKTELRAIKEDALSIAAIPVQYRNDAVVRHNPDGSVDVFFGGMFGDGDGDFHGHYHFEANGEITYRRDPFQDHGPQNYRGSKYQPEVDTPQTRQSFATKTVTSATRRCSSKRSRTR